MYGKKIGRIPVQKKGIAGMIAGLGCTAGVLYFVLIAAIAIGWVMNLWKFAHLDFEAPYKAEVLRGVSIFAVPLAGITGWMDLGEENNRPDR